MSVIIYIMDCTGHAFTLNPLHEQIFDTVDEAGLRVLEAHPMATRTDVEDCVGAWFLMDDDCREADSDQAWIEDL